MNKIILVLLLVFSSLSYSQLSWEKISNDPLNETLTSVFFLNKDIGWAVGYSGKIIHSTDGGKNWSLQVSKTTIALLDIYFINEKIGFAVGGKSNGSWSSSLLKVLGTTDGGKNWNNILEMNENVMSNIKFYNDSLGFIYGGSFGNYQGSIFKTTNTGKDWVKISNGFTKNLALPQDLSIINEDNYWLCGSFNTGDQLYETVLLRSTNGGKNWNSQIYRKTKEKMECLHFFNDSTGFVFGSNGTILKIEDYNEIWNDSKTMNSESFMRVKFFDKYSGVLLSGYGSVYKTTDAGETWKTFLAKDPKINFRKAYILDYDNIFAIDYSSQIVKLKNGNLLEVGNGDEYKNELLISPNPAKDQIIIKHNLVLSNDYKIEILDNLGNIISTFSNSELSKNALENAIDISYLSNGIYYFKLYYCNKIILKKLIVIK